MYFIDSEGSVSSHDADWPVPIGSTGPYLDLPQSVVDSQAEAIRLAQQVQTAQQMLHQSDKVMLQSYEEGLAAPATWVGFRNALRQFIASGAKLPMPTQPQKDS